MDYSIKTITKNTVFFSVNLFSFCHNTNHCYNQGLVLLNYLNSLQKSEKMIGKPRILSLFPQSFRNFNKHEHIPINQRQPYGTKRNVICICFHHTLYKPVKDLIIFFIKIKKMRQLSCSMSVCPGCKFSIPNLLAIWN